VSLRSQFPSADVTNDGLRAHSYNKILGEEDFIINDIVRKHHGHGTSDAFVRAGPRSSLHFDPKMVKAAIVTCGGLCPGLNNVIRELVHALTYLYGVQDILGIK
jgi:6-phosphofructokinase 1